MSIFTPALITVVASCIALTLGFSFLPCVAEKKPLYFKNSSIFAAVMTASALVLAILIPAVTHTETAPSPLTAAIVTILGFCGTVLTRHLPTGALKTFAKRMGKAVIIVFFVEAFICNFNRFTTDSKQLTQPLLSMAEISDPESAEVVDNTIVFTGDTTVSFEFNTEENVRAVSLKFDGDDKWIKTTLGMTDNNFGESPISVGSKFFSGTYERPVWFSIDPYETLKKLTITITDLQGPVTLRSMTFDSVLPYYFSDIRFFVMLLLTAIVLAIISFKFYKWEYSYKKIGHRIALAVTAVVCSASMMIFLVPEAPDNQPIKYSEDMTVSYHDPYVQMFDAFHKGQTELDIDPSGSLEALENPYDYSERNANGADFLWDRAYYNGKYYSYYPITPVLMFYYPYYYISGGYLPNMNKTTVFFGMIGVLLMAGALLALVKRFNKHPNFLLLILSVVACTVAGGFYMGTYYSSQYALPAVVSTTFLMMCLWCGVSGYNTIGKKISPILFALSGLGFALCVSARPTKSISALILAPLFIAILVRKNYTIKTKITSAVCFLAPALIGVVMIMAYNYARFDSFLEFGQSYQLTVSNIQANHTDLAFLPNSFMHYFLQPMNLAGDFPYLSPNYSVFCNNGKYMYEASNFGAFNFPVILLGSLAMPFLVWHTRHRKTTCAYTYNDNRVRNYTYVLMFVLMVFVGFADYCVGGAIDAYVMDILPVLMFMSVLVLMEIQTRMRKFPVFEGKTVCAVSIAMFATIVLGFMMLLTIRDYRKLLEHFPNLFSELERLICFWH